MKKTLSVILALAMLLTLTVPASAAFLGNSEYPIIFLKGTGDDIVDEEGNIVYDFDYDTSNMINDIVEVCAPLILAGITTGNYQPYYDTLYNKFAEIYGNAKLDENGDPLAGTDVINLPENETYANQKDKNSYGMHECHFYYDWRIDPWETADKLNDFIDEVLASSHKSKVSLYGRCMGATPILAYLAKYKSDKIDTVCLDSMVANGCELIGDVFTGNLNLDTAAILRFANGYWSNKGSDLIGDQLMFELIIATVKMLNSVGLSDQAIQTFMNTVFNSLGNGFISSFTRAGYATWPSYWTMVKSDELEKAKTVIFGKEGSELRTTYAGLIEKIDRCHENVTSKIPQILQETKASGTKVCVIAKYGSQLYPFVGSYNELSDQWISIGRASVGATACKINKTLPKSYIEQQTANGLERYISVDKQVDTSTCALPDNTWIIKGVVHDEWPILSEELAYAVCSGVITDINSREEYPQFLCYDKNTDTLAPMTEENMNCEDYRGTDSGSTANMSKKDLIVKRLAVLFEFLFVIFKFIANSFSK